MTADQAATTAPEQLQEFDVELTVSDVFRMRVRATGRQQASAFAWEAFCRSDDASRSDMYVSTSETARVTPHEMGG